jgi:hypothetical protein
MSKTCQAGKMAEGLAREVISQAKTGKSKLFALLSVRSYGRQYSPIVDKVTEPIYLRLTLS